MFIWPVSLNVQFNLKCITVLFQMILCVAPLIVLNLQHSNFGVRLTLPILTLQVKLAPHYSVDDVLLRQVGGLALSLPFLSLLTQFLLFYSDLSPACYDISVLFLFPISFFELEFLQFSLKLLNITLHYNKYNQPCL